jgi:hypothetical protein
MQDDKKTHFWQGIGVVVALAGVLVAIAAIVFSRWDRVHISVIPSVWETIGTESQTPLAIGRYDIAVTGSAPALNVRLKEYCRAGSPHVSRIVRDAESSEPRAVIVEDPVYKTSFIANSLPPAAARSGDCSANVPKGETPLYFFVEGVVTYEDGFGTHSTHFCFHSINLALGEKQQLQECRADQLEDIPPK